MENKKKKKKLTLSISGKKTHSVPHYESRGKTSVVIEKKNREKMGRKKIPTTRQ